MGLRMNWTKWEEAEDWYPRSVVVLNLLNDILLQESNFYKFGEYLVQNTKRFFLDSQTIDHYFEYFLGKEFMNGFVIELYM